MAAQPTKPANVLRAALDARRLPIMLKKVARRFFDTRGEISNEENLAWLEENCADFGEHATELDPGLWQEARAFEAELKEHAGRVLAEIEHDLGGGGFYPMIYFVIRLMKPSTVVETGVAAGFSSAAALSALKENGAGELWSSDFPYFRLPNPERYIGVVVAMELRENWRLLIDGDENNLPKIASEVKSIDLLHYDSDKTYSGRQRALETLGPRLADDAVVIMDDVQDNSHFHDLVRTREDAPWSVYRFEGKYVGLLGELTPSAARSALPS